MGIPTASSALFRKLDASPGKISLPAFVCFALRTKDCGACAVRSDQFYLSGSLESEVGQNAGHAHLESAPFPYGRRRHGRRSGFRPATLFTRQVMTAERRDRSLQLRDDMPGALNV